MTLDELLAAEAAAAEAAPRIPPPAPVAGYDALADLAERAEDAVGVVLPDGLGVRETARAAMRGVLPGLIRAASDSGLDVRERVAAAREIARLSGIADDAAPVRAARTWAELEADWNDVQAARSARLRRDSVVK